MRGLYFPLVLSFPKITSYGMSGGMCHICCSCRFTLWENITSKRRVRKGPLKVWLPRREQKFRDDLFITREKEESRSLLKKQPLIEVLKHTEIKKGDFDLCLSICFLDIYKIVLQPFKTTQKYKIAKIKKPQTEMTAQTTTKLHRRSDIWTRQNDSCWLTDELTHD